MNNSNICIWYYSDFAGCGHLRSIFPNEYLNSLYASKGLYEGIVASRFFLSDNVLSKVKTIHFQRQIENSQVQFMEFVRKCIFENKLDIKLIYDCDDLITGLPVYNRAYKTCSQPHILPNLQKIVNLVDEVTTSTYELKKEMEKLKGSCKLSIVPNFLPKFLYNNSIYKDKKENNKPRIVWAGSSTHFNHENKGDFEPIFQLLINTLDEFDWVLMGVRELPLWLQNYKSKITLVKWVRSMYEYPMDLQKINADFGVAPLQDNLFNRCKSNIKLLDYMSCDTMAICSKLPCYRDSQLFFSGDWKVDRDMILDIFGSKTKKEEIKTKQRRILEKYWLENNLKTYTDMLIR